MLTRLNRRWSIISRWLPTTALFLESFADYRFLGTWCKNREQITSLADTLVIPPRYIQDIKCICKWVSRICFAHEFHWAWNQSTITSLSNQRNSKLDSTIYHQRIAYCKKNAASQVLIHSTGPKIKLCTWAGGFWNLTTQAKN